MPSLPRSSISWHPIPEPSKTPPRGFRVEGTRCLEYGRTVSRNDGDTSRFWQWTQHVYPEKVPRIWNRIRTTDPQETKLGVVLTECPLPIFQLDRMPRQRGCPLTNKVRLGFTIPWSSHRATPLMLSKTCQELVSTSWRPQSWHPPSPSGSKTASVTT